MASNHDPETPLLDAVEALIAALDDIGCNCTCGQATEEEWSRMRRCQERVQHLMDEPLEDRG